ncbi:MAG: transglutaminaseTgpA domain-containing protein [Sulfurovum sp.]|nr:transglutaminaseTgpA domain-containing protein [Sulfurovum sp.]
MKSLLSLLSTRLPNRMHTLALLDIAYLVVLLPLIVILKIPMILFILFILGLLFFKDTPASNALIMSVFILGSIAVFLSMYGAFSFSGLSRLRIFLELLVYILLIVVSMQRLTREINFYLLISPFLFLALSLFFYHGMLMLGYVIVEIFVLLWMVLAYHTKGQMIESFRSAMVMFMYSLPWVVLLFIFFSSYLF